MLHFLSEEGKYSCKKENMAFVRAPAYFSHRRKNGLLKTGNRGAPARGK
jgi:hypothetical protein